MEYQYMKCENIRYVLRAVDMKNISFGTGEGFYHDFITLCAIRHGRKNLSLGGKIPCDSSIDMLSMKETTLHIRK